MNIVSSIFFDMFSAFGDLFEILSYIWYLVLPFVLYKFFKIIWMDHINRKYGGKIQSILLEIIPPQNIEKSPQPMESLYSGLAGTMKTPNVYEEYLDGYFPASFSFELVGTGGSGVHFYIRTPKHFRYLVEAHFYAQYPDVEIQEVPDYVNNVPPVIPNKDWDIWGADYELTDPDPLPIKTYRNFEEDVTGKMIDPLAGLIEIMGQLPPGQNLWLQYVATPVGEQVSKQAGKELVELLAGRVPKKSSGFFASLFKEIGEIFSGVFTTLSGKVPEPSSGAQEKKEEEPLEFRLTPGEKRVLEDLETNIGKNMFSVKMRVAYVGRRDGFDKATFVSGINGGLKQFSDLNFNGFKPEEPTKTYANYVDTERRLKRRQRKLFSWYKDRDTSDTKFLMSTEELATVFHLPDMAVSSPFFRRVSAKRSSAPINLPF